MRKIAQLFVVENEQTIEIFCRIQHQQFKCATQQKLIAPRMLTT